nr:collagen alpha-1(I) chain-like [Taeniopygia guttata]
MPCCIENPNSPHRKLPCRRISSGALAPWCTPPVLGNGSVSVPRNLTRLFQCPEKRLQRCPGHPGPGGRSGPGSQGAPGCSGAEASPEPGRAGRPRSPHAPGPGPACGATPSGARREAPPRRGPARGTGPAPRPPPAPHRRGQTCGGAEAPAHPRGGGGEGAQQRERAPGAAGRGPHLHHVRRAEVTAGRGCTGTAARDALGISDRHWTHPGHARDTPGTRSGHTRVTPPPLGKRPRTPPRPQTRPPSPSQPPAPHGSRSLTAPGPAQPPAPHSSRIPVPHSPRPLTDPGPAQLPAPHSPRFWCSRPSALTKRVNKYRRAVSTCDRERLRKPIRWTSCSHHSCAGEA